ncbi:glycoside hydrolase/deacetylase [Wilcoxina mikolae CBS 423.85]|nr:glycoside hydrolase/deacetylase [Wilcoxina mikolae CBS 423.85]
MFSILLLLFSAAVSSQLIIDNFLSDTTNALGSWHGCDTTQTITCTFTGNTLRILSTDVDNSFYTQLVGGCQDLTPLSSHYLHLSLSGSTSFTIALQQHNRFCSESVAPFPETWDVVFANDYNIAGEIYVPLSHFDIVKTRAIGFAFKAFREASVPTVLKLVEIVPTLPKGRKVPNKKKTGRLVFACERTDAIAFGIDDGVPELAQRMMKILEDEGVKVTFFTVGNSLVDQAGNFTEVYREAIKRGHQVALHSMTHPKLESLSVAQIDAEFSQSLAVAKQKLGNAVTTKYFRAPYGTDGALTRQRLEAAVGGGSRVINWSVDIEDWLWGESDTPWLQVDAVKRDLTKGGNLFVAHYLYESTVQYFPEFIKLAKATGKKIMRVDQCLGDPNAPPL